MAPHELRTPRAGIFGLVYISESARIPAIELAATRSLSATHRVGDDDLLHCQRLNRAPGEIRGAVVKQ